jgi:hypothetical protein
MSRSVPLQADCRRSVRSGHRKLPPSSCSRWRRAGATWRSRGEEFITSNELPVLLEMAKRAGTHILPIILKSCGFTSHQSLSVFQAVNDPHRPVLTLSVHEQELTRQCSATSVIVSTAWRRGRESRGFTVVVPPLAGDRLAQPVLRRRLSARVGERAGAEPLWEAGARGCRWLAGGDVLAHRRAAIRSAKRGYSRKCGTVPQRPLVAWAHC